MLTYKGMLPIHCMQVVKCVYGLINDTMNNNVDSIYNVAWIVMIIVHTADWIEKQCSDVANISISFQL